MNRSSVPSTKGYISTLVLCARAESQPASRQQWHSTIDTVADTITVRTTAGSVWDDTVTLEPDNQPWLPAPALTTRVDLARAHQTPDLNASQWKYWHTSFGSYLVVWDGAGRVRDVIADPETRAAVLYEQGRWAMTSGGRAPTSGTAQGRLRDRINGNQRAARL